MSHSKANLLLVEGINDKSFFETLFKKLQLNAAVTIAPATEVGGERNTKDGLFKIFPTQLNFLADADAPLQRLALVVDADQIADGGGFDGTVARAVRRLRELDYNEQPVRLENGGLVFKHDDGLPDVGLWVMPDNSSEGTLENWLEAAIHQDEKALFDLAKDRVSKLPEQKFKPLHIPKAEVATWLAWQRIPGEGADYAVQEGLLDTESNAYQGLVEWLMHCFNDQKIAEML